jgi:hypothetical protein
MPNIFQRFFNRNKFPKIDWGQRFEGIEYRTASNFLYIDSTFIGGRKIYTDSIKYWQDKQPIIKSEKVIIFKDIIEFANRNSNQKPIIVINIDYDLTFWETLCQENSDLIKEIQYDSDKSKEDFQFNDLLDSVRKNGTLIFGDKTIKTEAEFLEYWNNIKNPPTELPPT